MISTSKSVQQLAQLLRDSGDKILSSEFKLTLSGKFMCYFVFDYDASFPHSSFIINNIE